MYANNRLSILLSGLCFRFHWFLNMTSLHRNTYTQIISYVYMRYICLCIHTHICMCMCIYIYIYIYICAVIPHTALLSHSKLPQGKFLHRDSPSLSLYLFIILYKLYIVLKLLQFLLHIETSLTFQSNPLNKLRFQERALMFSVTFVCFAGTVFDRC